LESNEPLREIKILPEGTEVNRAVVWYVSNRAMLTCIELYDKDGLKLLEAGETLDDR
jgi:hypothetical protein